MLEKLGEYKIGQVVKFSCGTYWDKNCKTADVVGRIYKIKIRNATDPEKRWIEYYIRVGKESYSTGWHGIHGLLVLETLRRAKC